MVKTPELGITKAASLSEAAQEQLGRELLERIESSRSCGLKSRSGSGSWMPGSERKSISRTLFGKRAPSMPAKRRQVIWAPKAKQDLREVWLYYRRVASPEIADKLLRDIGQAGERLAEQAAADFKGREPKLLGRHRAR